MTQSSSTLNTKTKIIVQKFGGATLADPEKIKAVAKRIANLQASGSKVVVVVSAMGQTTNELINLAKQVSSRPHLREMDMLLTAGERISMSLLSMALLDLGCSAISFTGSQAGIMTDDSHVNAQIIDVKAFRVEQALSENKIVILAGFQGVSPQTKEITTLGRGGSDISAVSMSAYLKAERCEILKDVDGVYSADPKIVEEAHPLTELGYVHLLDMTTWGAQVLNHKSVSLAEEKNVPLFVGSAANEKLTGTLISAKAQFTKQRPLAINSFKTVFEIKLQSATDSFEQLQNFLQKNQIAQVQMLSTIEINADDVAANDLRAHFYVTAPKETLDNLLEFEKNQNFFVIASKNLSSVSVTLTNKSSPEDLYRYNELLAANGVQSLHRAQSAYSVHFIINSANRLSAIRTLHSLCKP